MFSKIAQMAVKIEKDWSDAVFLADCPVTMEEEESWFWSDAPRKLVASYIMLRNWYWDAKSAILCRRGHDYEDHSDASCAESGRFDMVCKRCGHSVSGYW